MIRSWRIKKEICEIGKRLYDLGLIVANEGNISFRFDKNCIFITPSMVCKGELSPRDIVRMDYHGKYVSKYIPSSEWRIHLSIYRNFPEIDAVIHTHPPFSTAFSVTRIEQFEHILPEILIFESGIKVVPYAPPSSDKLAEQVVRHLENSKVLLLQNHGLLTVGKDLKEAFSHTERCEHFFKILFLSKMLGKIRELSEKEIEELKLIFHLNETK